MAQIPVRPQGLHLTLMPADVHQRMVRDDQLAAQRFRLCHNILRDVQCHQNTLYLLSRIAFQMAHIIPVEGQFLRSKLEQRLFNLFNSWHDATPLLPVIKR